MQLSENSPDPAPDFRAIKDRSLEGAAATAAGQAVRFTIQVVSQVWLARLISPADSGLVAMVSPILGFISIISDLGIGTALIQQKSVSQSQMTALFWLNAVVSLAVSLLLITASPLVGMLYREPKTIPITIALAALFAISSLGIYPSAILTRELRLARRAGIESVQSFVGLVVGVATAKAGCGYWSLIYLQAANTVSGVALAWWSASWTPSRPRWDQTANRIMRFGTSLTASNIATYFSVSADNMIVGAVKGKVELGLYDKAYRLVVQPLTQLSTPIGRVAIPVLSRLQSDPNRYAAAFRPMMQIPILVFTPGLICGMFLSSRLVSIFLGPSWSGIAAVFSWVCVGGLASSTYGSAFWLFTSQGRGREQMKWAAITSAISVASFAIGVRWGAVGVACAAGVGFVFLQTPMILWAATRTGPVSARHLVRAMRPLIVASFVTTPAIYMYSRFVHASSIVELCGGVVLSHMLYVLTILSMSSGREMLSSTAGLAISYLGRLRAGLKRQAA